MVYCLSQRVGKRKNRTKALEKKKQVMEEEKVHNYAFTYLYL